MPSATQVRQFLTLTVLPVIVAALANWIVVHVHALAEFHVTAGSVASVVSQLGVFGITAVIAFLTSHHILSGSYKPVKPLPTQFISPTSGNVSWVGTGPSNVGTSAGGEPPATPPAAK